MLGPHVSFSLTNYSHKAKRLAQDLISRATEVVEKRPSSDESENSERSVRVPLGLRKATVDHVMDMLARESVFPYHPSPPALNIEN